LQKELKGIIFVLVRPSIGEKGADMSSVTERCPWCDSLISRSKFLEIETRIREEQAKNLEDAEVQMRKSLEVRFAQDLEKQRQAIDTNAKLELARQLASIGGERDALASKLQQAESQAVEIRSNAQKEAERVFNLRLQEVDRQRQKEAGEQRSALEKDRDLALLKQSAEFTRERESFQEKIQEMNRQLSRRSSQEIGDGAEIDLYETLRETFPSDQITRIQIGHPGADILHEVMYKGQPCGRIVIDSKNRKAWQNAFVMKLRQDQTEAGAEHAILSSTAFPSGKKELCIESEVIVVSPARVQHVVTLLRRTMITVHVRGLSIKERAGKMNRLYKLITSEGYAQKFGELVNLTNDVLDLDVQEKKSHDSVWKKRGGLATRMNSVLRELDTQVSGIVESAEEQELSVA
jgi:hypothetical protein